MQTQVQKGKVDQQVVLPQMDVVYDGGTLGHLVRALALAGLLVGRRWWAAGRWRRAPEREDMELPGPVGAEVGSELPTWGSTCPAPAHYDATNWVAPSLWSKHHSNCPVVPSSDPSVC